MTHANAAPGAAPRSLPVIGIAVTLLIVGFASLLAIVGAGIWLNERAKTYFDASIEARDTRAAATELRHAIEAAESSQRGFLVSGNQIYLAPYSTARTLALQQLSIVETDLSAIPASQPAFERLKAVILEKLEEMDTLIALKRDRQDAEVLAEFRTNRGKALMDEANVFLSSIIRGADERLTRGVEEQRENAALLRSISLAAATLIVVVVGIVLGTVAAYARNLRRARDQVSELNRGLESRVEERTAELVRARDRAEVLLAEVNHRVANSLSLVGAMVSLQANAADSEATKDVLHETQARIYAVSLVHRRLYTSNDAREVDLDEYFVGLLSHLEASMRDAGHRAWIKHSLDSIKLPTDKTVNLAVVATEWITNAFKYAYPREPGEVRVRLTQPDPRTVELTIEDDGIGRDPKQAPKGTGLGTKLVSAMASSMGASIVYADGRPGTVARLLVPVSEAA